MGDRRQPGPQPKRADQVAMRVDLEGGMSIAAATAVFERGEQAVLALEGIELVESTLRGSGGSLTVHFDPRQVRWRRDTCTSTQ